jgi:putative hydrolase of the HAD superfamily
VSEFLELRTERLIIDRLTPDDIDTVVAYRNDPRIFEFQSWAIPFTREHVERLIAFTPPAGEGMAAGGQFAVRVHDGTLIGDVAVQLAPGIAHGRELGVTLGGRWHGHGYASETIRAVINELFADPSVQKLVAYVAGANKPSLRLFDRQGFRREGNLRISWRLPDGTLTDEILFGFTRSDWNRAEGSFDVVAFDADDTLWASEDGFYAAEHKFVDLVSPYVDEGIDVKSALTAVERKNLHAFGYGVRAFGLSMVECATSLVGESGIPAAVIGELVEMARSLLAAPVHLLPDVAHVLEDVSRDHRVIMITKGDLLHQTAKVEASGLARHFEKIEIVSEKDSATYARIIAEQGVPPSRFCMVGNSVRSDILPVLALGASAVHVPYHLLWDLEQAPHDHGHTFAELKSLAELPAWLRESTTARDE